MPNSPSAPPPVNLSGFAARTQWTLEQGGHSILFIIFLAPGRRRADIPE
jgi:hypothetical protein